MSTLRQFCKYALVKLDIVPRVDLPDKLPCELESMELKVKLDMSGNYYADSHIPNCADSVKTTYGGFKNFSSRPSSGQAQLVTRPG